MFRVLGLQRIKLVHFTLNRPTKKIHCNDNDFGGLILSEKKFKLTWRKRTAATRDRTKDLQIFSLTLSQLSYSGTYKMWYECKHIVNESRLRCSKNYFKRRVAWSTSIFSFFTTYMTCQFENMLFMSWLHAAILTFENVYSFRIDRIRSIWEVYLSYSTLS